MIRIDNLATHTNSILHTSSIRIASTGCTHRSFTVALVAEAPGAKFSSFMILEEATGRISAQQYISVDSSPFFTKQCWQMLKCENGYKLTKSS